VDNGSVDKTAAIVRNFSQTSDIALRYVFEPARGLANAHNAGVRNSRGVILAFTDDDCYPQDDFLQEMWAAFADPSVGYVGGRILLHDPTDYPATINESIIRRTFSARSFVPPGAIQGANMAFRRQVLLDIGGFDPFFGPGALFVAEDIDAVSRASSIGWKGLYCPKVVVRHDHGRKASDIPALARSYAIGRGAWQIKLLLQGHRFLWFSRAVCGFPRRFRWEPRALWEVVGAARYAYLFSTGVIRNRVDVIAERRGDWSDK
jgi:cellulose synthase/poly-beta-1,6-N-acetylglucosamine synthase-like glycosyltransferase